MHTVPPTGAGPAERGRTFPLVLGLDTFGDVGEDPSGRPLTHAQTIRNLVEEGIVAEECGVDFFGIGQHHTADMPLSAADVVLAAVAARTTRIGLGCALTVLGPEDPVRVFQRFSTLDAISGGRAEIVLGRGSGDSSPLFGSHRADRDRLFEERAGLFATLLDGGPVTWAGSTRAPLTGRDVVPHPEVGSFPAWIGVRGNRESVVRAARYGYSLMLGIVDGPPGRAAALARLFRESLRRFDRPRLPVAVHSPGHLAATDEQARDEFWPRYAKAMRRMSEVRGSPVPTEDGFLHEAGPDGALYVGSPETVARKITATLRTVGATRFDLRYGMGGLSREALLTTISLYGTEVVPRVRALTAAQPPARN